jgi:hypothetical protein
VTALAFTLLASFLFDVYPLLFVLIAVTFVDVIRTLAKVISRGRAISWAYRNDFYTDGLIEHHEEAVKVFLWSGLSAVLAVEFSVRFSGGLWGPLWLRLLHGFFVIVTVLALAGAWWWNGKKAPTKHGRFAYTFVIFLMPTILTGTTLFLMHPYFR